MTRRCADWCGRGCTEEEYQKAWKDAVALARDLTVDVTMVWNPRVWENLGWWYSAVSTCGRLEVIPSKTDKGCHAYLRPAGGGGGRWCRYGKTPEQAVKNVIAEARREIDHLQAIIEGLP
jgi:hypothetical protein